MSFSLTLLSDGEPSAPTLSALDIGGEDISLVGGDMTETPSGDLGTVVGPAAARQSIVRELPANPNSFPRRPSWGGGLSGLLFKGASVANRERAESRARARCLANPRVTRVNSVTSVIESTSGIRVDVDVSTPGGRISASAVVKPPGVR